ncbi:Peptidase M23 [Candidatus Filomicrobium marinum]|uniref:Peptidase M23 n=2 Tax=Filomicrobium TaxID=119044 RepID=A0A0D6JCK0_9HYPH|nr:MULTISPECIES: peptidoglycan DD-metalloendopeptidase family protein [Filomicrobium]MCV0368418.1 peptidoglycan DD-metalloendopeptidase family protein [Filomicrobium sp.]CFX10921.1 Peptidase M23 [Candidatus Filomicrobium marinum]CPR17193.1 Peptidase M23 [Candidatus Filomicrobium marinum]SDO38269.1 Septal ring factor EnvC, activator of murein hydrolases AmiA and AmiB [Filomicrobium insigne]
MRVPRQRLRVKFAAVPVLCILAGCIPAVLPAAAQSRDDAKSKLDAQTKELQNKLGRQQALETDVAAIAKERERINARLLETADLIKKSEARMTEIEARLDELGEQERVVRGSLNQRRDKIAKLLAVLQRMGRNPPPVMITKREDALAMVRSAMLLASAFPGLRSQALELTNKLDELVRVMAETRSEGEHLKLETTRLNDARTRLSGLMVEKKSSLTERQAELTKVRQATDEISKNVDNLRALIARADQAAVQSNSRITAHNAKAEAAERLAETGNSGVTTLTPDQPESSASSSNDGVKVAVLAPSAAGFGSVDAGRIEPAIPFHLAKGRLPRPTSGKHVLSFGQQTEYGGTSKGLVFQTRFSSQITSPCDGWIVYAGEFRSYGQLLIINAGGGYHVLLAGLSRIDVEPGQFVLAAEPVGTMGDAPPSVQRGSEDAKPVLYVEFRKDGRPIDPDPWWVKDPEKVQG